MKLFNWHEMPFVRILLPFIFGIVLADRLLFILPENIFYVLGGVGILLVVQNLLTPSYRYRWVFGFLSFLAFTLLGMVTYVGNNHKSQPFCIGSIADAEAVLVMGRVWEEPTKKNWIRVRVKCLAKLEKNSKQERIKGKIELLLQPKEKGEIPKPGDLMIIKTKLQEIPAPKHKDQFDYKRYLYYQNIHYRGFVKKNNWSLLVTNENFSIDFWKWRIQLLEVLKKYLPRESEYAVASALILGEKSNLSTEIKSLYSETGAMHVLAVSGLHVGLIFLFLRYFFQLLPFRGKGWRAAKLFIYLISIWGYALLSGGSSSALRAAAMFSFFILGKSLQERTSTYNILAIAGYFLLLTNPFQLFQPGFQFSYLAVAGILFFQPYISDLLAVKNKILNHFWQLTSVSVAAQISVLPLSIYYFQKIPLYFWLSSLIVIDAAFAILALGMLTILGHFFCPKLAIHTGCALEKVITISNDILENIKALPAHQLEEMEITVPQLLLAYCVLFLLGIFLASKKHEWIRRMAWLLLLYSLIQGIYSYF